MLSDRTAKIRIQGARVNFDELLIEAIDLTLSCFGESTKIAVYAHLEIIFSIKKEEIPSKLEDFSRALETLMGSGAKPLEILIMKNLHAKLKDVGECVACDWVTPQMGFLKYVDFEKQRFEEATKNGKEWVFINETEQEPICS